MTNNYTGKGRFELRVDRPTAVLSGEMVSVANVLQVNELTVTGPYSGDFQIIDNGRLIVGSSPDVGSRIIISPKSMAGYSAAGTKTFSLWTSTSPDGNNTPGDLHLGNLAANFLLYDHSEGTLGLYTPAGAGILLDNDGSARFGQGDGAHMLWDSASSSLKFISGLSDEGPIIAAEIDTQGNASFVGNITATGGRITGDMQVDARLRAGDVDGPAVYIGKLTNEDGSAYAGQILVTDTENVPWFSVTTGNDGTGHLQIGRPGNYPNRLTLDVTATGSTLVYDGDIYTGNGNIAGWTINSTQLVSPAGYVTLDYANGVVFNVYDYGASLGVSDGFSGLNNRMISYVSNTEILHRLEAYADTVASQGRETLMVHAGNRTGRSQLLMRAIATGEAQVRVQAIGGYDLAGQIDANLNILAYRSEGAWDHSRMEFNADTLALQAWTGAAEPDTGSALPDGLLVYTDGTWDPAGGEGWYANFGGTWSRITGPYPQKWGTSSNYVAIDSNGSITFTGSAYIVARYDKETQTTGFTVSKRTTRVNATGGAVTATLPTATSAAGKHFTIKKIDASGNAVTVDGDGAETIDGAATYSLATQYKSVTVASNGTSWDIIGAT